MTVNFSGEQSASTLTDAAERVKREFRCPRCGGSVELEADIMCRACKAYYPVREGVPVFSYDVIDSKMPTTKEKSTLANLRARLPFLHTLAQRLRPPSLDLLSRGRDALEETLTNARASADQFVGLDVGAGSKRWHDVVAFDLFKYPGIDVCGRAEEMPFRDATFDFVVSTTALEHMMNAERVMAEMDRVLKPGGVLFVTVPFLYPYHPEPFDLKRWSADGIRRAFGDYETIEMGACGGPHATMYVMLSSYLSWMLSFRSYPLYVALDFLFKWSFLPLKAVDQMHGRYTRSTPLDSVVFFAGRKRA